MREEPPSPVSAAIRLEKLPKNAFHELAILKEGLAAKGKSFVDLSEGVPDLPPPAKLLDYLSRVSSRSELHSYTSLGGSRQLRAALTDFLRAEFQVDREVGLVPGAGSKELIGLLCQAILNPGDVALVPELYYPLYPSAVRFAGAEPLTYPMRAATRWQPRIYAMPEDILDRTKLIFLNYPHNPTGAMIDDDELMCTVSICQERRIVLCLDLAYSHMCLRQDVSSGILGDCQTLDGLIELHTFSKSLGVPGWRVAFAAGDPALIELLEKTRAVFGTGLPATIQKSLRYGLVHFKELTTSHRDTYRTRVRDAVNLLRSRGIDATEPDGSFFLWVQLPPAMPMATTFVRELLLSRGVLVMPGCAFGEGEDRHIRIALTQSWDVLEGALEHLAAHINNHA